MSLFEWGLEARTRFEPVVEVPGPQPYHTKVRPVEPSRA